jgi:putative transposase
MYEVFIRIDGVQHYLWRAVDHEGLLVAGFQRYRVGRTRALSRVRWITTLMR